MADNVNGKTVENAWQFLIKIGDRHGFNALMLLLACAALWFLVGAPMRAQQAQDLKDRALLMELLTDSTERGTAAQEKMAMAVDTLQASQLALVSAVQQNGTKIDQTTHLMEQSFVLMEDVPELRQQELATLKGIEQNIIGQEVRDHLKQFTENVQNTHEQQVEDHKTIIEKLP